MIPNDTVVLQKTRGEHFSIDCNISIPSSRDAHPEAIYWLKNKVIVPILCDKLYVGELRTTLKPLVFSSVSPKDSGNYSCVLETKLKRIRPFNITGGPYIINSKQLSHTLHKSKVDREMIASLIIISFFVYIRTSS